jgi:hypothetical protein
LTRQMEIGLKVKLKEWQGLRQATNEVVTSQTSKKVREERRWKGTERG